MQSSPAVFDDASTSSVRRGAPNSHAKNTQMPWPTTVTTATMTTRITRVSITGAALRLSSLRKHGRRASLAHPSAPTPLDPQMAILFPYGGRNHGHSLAPASPGYRVSTAKSVRKPSLPPQNIPQDSISVQPPRDLLLLLVKLVNWVLLPNFLLVGQPVAEGLAAAAAAV